MPRRNPYLLTRKQLSDFLGRDDDAIRKFEKVFEVVDMVLPSTPADLNLAAANAEAKAGLALAEIEGLKESLAVLEMGSAESKANQALFELQRIADALEVLAYGPQPRPFAQFVDVEDAYDDTTTWVGVVRDQAGVQSLCTDAGLTYNASTGVLSASFSGTFSGSFVDSNFSILGSSDATKILKFEVDGFTAGATRTLTPPNLSGTIATIDGGQTFTSAVWQGTSISTTYTDAKVKTVTGTTNRLDIGGTATDPTFDISTSYVGQNTITTLGTITTGTWNAAIVGVTYGGTGANLSATGGASKVLMQISAGAAVTVAQLAASDLSNGTTGSGSVVLATSPTLVTPILGTPTSGTLTNCTGLPISSGVSGLGTNVATFLATPSSANLAAALTDETGTGAAVFGTSPTLGGTQTYSTLTGTASCGRLVAEVTKGAISDNVATGVFTVTTTDESGSADGGCYTVKICATITHASGSGNASEAVLYGEYIFCRAVNSSGAGTNSAVEVIHQTASVSTASATRDISTVTVTVTETSEYVQTVNFQIDLTGSSVSTARVIARVEVQYHGFTTSPTIATA